MAKCSYWWKFHRTFLFTTWWMSSALCASRISRSQCWRYGWRSASSIWTEIGKFGIIWSSSKFNNLVAFEKWFTVSIDSKVHWSKNAKFTLAFGQWWEWVKTKRILENWKRLLQIRNDFDFWNFVHVVATFWCMQLIWTKSKSLKVQHLNRKLDDFIWGGECGQYDAEALDLKIRLHSIAGYHSSSAIRNSAFTAL